MGSKITKSGKWWQSMTTPLELKPEQAARFKSLIQGDNRGNHHIVGRKGRQLKIKPDQLRQIKELRDMNFTYSEIGLEVGLSLWIVTHAVKGDYNHILEK